MAAAKPKDSVSRFTIKGGSYEIDADRLTWGEMEEMETYFDAPIGDVELESARATMFLAYLAKRRTEPRTTLDEIRALEIGDIVAAAPERPTRRGAARSGTPAS